MKSNKGIEVITGAHQKKMNSDNAHFIFNKTTGTMITWGTSIENDPESFPAPTILDMEVTTKCDGVGGLLCPFCYKANNPNGKNMTFETFKSIFDGMNESLTQIAFGADSKGTSNPDLFLMMEYAKQNGVIPNITVADVSDEVANKLSHLCGAVAVSRYHDPDICYNSVKKLTDRGMSQVNIHMMISEETYERAVETLRDIKQDERLSKLNAIVFLSLKQKGRGSKHNTLSQSKFNSLVSIARSLSINYGFDSCSSLKFFNSLSSEDYTKYKDVIMPCESTLESSYINVDGEFFPCSFTEGTEGWETGISAVGVNFVEDVWNHPRVEEFRGKLISTKPCNKFGCRECPIYSI